MKKKKKRKKIMQNEKGLLRAKHGPSARKVDC